MTYADAAQEYAIYDQAFRSTFSEYPKGTGRASQVVAAIRLEFHFTVR
ncbi:MAG: hypothetical protein AB7V46_11280 [Thermomicrobiales bacterium]